jgi:hypothetical protein
MRRPLRLQQQTAAHTCHTPVLWQCVCAVLGLQCQEWCRFPTLSKGLPAFSCVPYQAHVACRTNCSGAAVALCAACNLGNAARCVPLCATSALLVQCMQGGRQHPNSSLALYVKCVSLACLSAFYCACPSWPRLHVFDYHPCVLCV